MRQGLRLGVDLGGTQVKMALVDHRGRLAAQAAVETVKNPRRLVAAMKAAAQVWFHKRLLGTGVGVAGDIDSARGVVRVSPNLGWRNVPLKKMLKSAGFPQPLFIDNDANAAAWGAFHVELKGKSDDLVVLTLGTGVGGGVVLKGHLLHGVTGSAAELGHMNVDPRGLRCSCGNLGCLETFLGKDYLLASARREWARRGRRWPKGMTPFHLAQIARRGDAAAKAVWARAGSALGVGLGNLINIFNPDTILLCGGIAGASGLLLRSAAPGIRRAFATPRRAARIRVAANTRHLGVVGAALLVE